MRVGARPHFRVEKDYTQKRRSFNHSNPPPEFPQRFCANPTRWSHPEWGHPLPPTVPTPWLRQLPCHNNYRRSVWILSKFAAILDEHNHIQRSGRRNSPPKDCWASGVIPSGTVHLIATERVSILICRLARSQSNRHECQIRHRPNSCCGVPFRNRRPAVPRIPLTSFDEILGSTE